MSKEEVINSSFDLLGDNELLAMLQSGELDELPSFSTDEVTATQVLGLSTQDLVVIAKPCVEDHSKVEPITDVSHFMNNIADVSYQVNNEAGTLKNDRKPLSTISSVITAAQENTKTSISSSRFGDPISLHQIREKNAGAVPKKTRAVNDWSVKVWADWARSRNAQPVTVFEPGFPIPEDIGQCDSAVLNYWGQRFVNEIKRQDGADYPPNTLLQIVCGLQRYLRTECGKQQINLLKEDCIEFSDFRRSLDARMKELYAAGLGTKRSSSDAITMDDEIAFWESGVFSSSTASGLSNAIFYYNGKLFGFRGFQEHINCQANQFQIITDSEQKRRYILFTPGLRKNSQGGIKGRKTVQEPVRHYEQPDRKYNLVDMYDKYLKLIPKVGPLYRKPLNGVDENNNVKFSSATISQYGIKTMIKRFFQEAGIDAADRKLTNHSARVTLCTTLYNKNFTDKAVTSRSKHRSNAVHTYQREQFPILNSISGALEPNVKRSEEVTGDKVPEVSVSTAPTKTEHDLAAMESSNSLPTSIAAKNVDVDNSLVINVPNSVKSVVIVKSDGKKMVIEI